MFDSCCSSVVTEKSPKKGSSSSTIIYIKGNAQPFTRYHIKETLIHFNMASQVNKKKTYQQFKEEKKRNYEEVFHEILLLQGTTASGQLLEVQNSVLPLTTFPHPSKPPLTTIPVKLNLFPIQPKKLLSRISQED